MRKNVIALMLLLPLLFLLSVFSAVKRASLGVPISASGIEILGKPEDETYRIDLSRYEGEYKVEARVFPEGAGERGYFLRAEGAVETDGNVIVPKGAGEGKITAVSKDGGFEDSVRVVVYATEPYDFLPQLTPLGGGADLLEAREQTFYASLQTGRYALSFQTFPEDRFTSPKIETDGSAFYDEASGELLLPFGGQTEISLSMQGKRGNKPFLLEKTLVLETESPKTTTGYLVNGGDSALIVDRESASSGFYVESAFPPSFAPDPHVRRVETETLGEGRYRVTVYFTELREDFSLRISDGEEIATFTFSDFDFTLRSELPVLLSDEASVIKGVPVAFYAVPSVAADVSYEWTAEGASLAPSSNGSVCTVTLQNTDKTLLRVRAFRNGKLLDLFPKELRLSAVERVTSAQFTERSDLGLGKFRAVAGLRYEGGKAVENRTELHPVAFGAEGERVGLRNLEFSSSDERIASLSFEDGKLFLIPKGTGKVKLFADWRGNTSFGTNVRAETELYIAKEAVEARASEELYAAMQERRAAVLEEDIFLGTDKSGAPLPIAEREKLLGSMKSTYNIAYYLNADDRKEEDAYVRYALELTADVYGNGHTVNAEYLTDALDGAGKPYWFRGPLCLVRFGELASVAAQDNCAYLLRTDGVRLNNLTLLGCGDEALAGENGYDLSQLNNVGTTLEINADAELLNCRVRNGRNVVRVYGGNRSGNAYFAESLQGPGRTERISVKIEGCVLSQGREFLLKLGANRALLATKENGGAEPDLRDATGAQYPPRRDELLNDEEFYNRYVLTDVLLKDSVLETSGLFTIGLESNFSGELLYRDGGTDAFDGWRGVGGTSFASCLRLEGDVRLYDWKELSLIDSSTLIETEMPELKLNIAAMLDFAASTEPEKYGDILAEEGGKRYVHGGIAFYGGGKNYAGLCTEKLERGGFKEYSVNLSVLQGAEGNTGHLGQILPLAAGEQDFRFFLYTREGEMGYERQKRDIAEGKKYEGIKPAGP